MDGTREVTELAPNGHPFSFTADTFTEVNHEMEMYLYIVFALWCYTVPAFSRLSYSSSSSHEPIHSSTYSPFFADEKGTIEEKKTSIPEGVVNMLPVYTLECDTFTARAESISATNTSSPWLWRDGDCQKCQSSGRFFPFCNPVEEKSFDSRQQTAPTVTHHCPAPSYLLCIGRNIVALALSLNAENSYCRVFAMTHCRKVCKDFSEFNQKAVDAMRIEVLY